MKLQLDINYLLNSKSNDKPYFYLDTTIIEELLDKTHNQNIVKLNYFEFDGVFKGIEEIKSINSHFRNFIPKSNDKSFLFYLTKAESDVIVNNYVQFWCFHNGIQITLSVDLELNSSQLSDLNNFALSIYDTFVKDFIFGPSFNIRIQDVDYIRYRPVRDYQGLGQNALINYLHPPYFERDKIYSASNGIDEREDLKLIGLQYQDGFKFEEHNGLYCIHWTDKIESMQQIQDVLTKREEFIYKNLNLKPRSDFNQHGDKNIFPVSSLAKAPTQETFFNFYTERFGTAYKLITLNKHKELEQEVLETIKTYLQTRKLSNGLPLEKIVLILPSRETAIAAEKQMRPLGVHKVVYLDNYANVWDMRPVGKWRN